MPMRRAYLPVNAKRLRESGSCSSGRSGTRSRLTKSIDAPFGTVAASDGLKRAMYRYGFDWSPSSTTMSPVTEAVDAGSMTMLTPPLNEARRMSREKTLNGVQAPSLPPQRPAVSWLKP